MASRVGLLEDQLSCLLCHNIFEDPVVLSCSHSFCNTCLQNCWRDISTQECPNCKRRSSKSEPLVNFALKKQCEAFLQQRVPAESEEVCIHVEKFQYFCLDHQKPVCLVCRDSEQHTNHSFRPIDEAAQHHKSEVQKSLEPLKEKLNVLHKAKRDLVQTAEQIKVQAQDTERQIKKEFEKLQKILKGEKEARICSLRQDKNNNTQMMNKKINSLDRLISNISDAIKNVEKELEAPDVSFLQKYKTTAEIVQQPLSQEPQWPSGAQTDVTKHLGHFKTYLWDKFHQILGPSMIECVASSLDTTVRPREDPTVRPREDPTVRPREDPTLRPREDPTVVTFSALRKCACELTLDTHTVHNRLSLSEDNRMVTQGENQSYPDHPDRFTTWSQVLCREGLTGRCYWEVDWRGEVYIGVAYRGISRGERGAECLGHNKTSWALLCKDEGYTAWHDNIPTPVPVSSECKRVGVYVDWPAGSLSFYSVSSDTLTHLHTFYCTFTKPLMPGFWVWKSGSP